METRWQMLEPALVERWRPETYTFHLPWGECTVILEDVAMQLGLPIDGEPDIWQWCEELLGEVPDGHVWTTKYNIKLKWLRSRLQRMPLDSPEDVVVWYARCYIMYLLGGVLRPDKVNNTRFTCVIFPSWPTMTPLAPIVGAAPCSIGYIEPCA
ncbi:hypothetical protein Ahy_Scaffold6g108059 [Arachis hypogaea]|uniref:Aminotransferase-like plant mobile domain-containing protein n=1 Tax=Arachis hypogaea TaxID=3818 RepID=A0A444WPQ9_ARAHY|nr:hypothetical protein Ahy_Scaffold6g108059 [Arachis hypogaea]